MKKTIFCVMFVMFVGMFVSCGNRTEATAPVNDSDTCVVDSADTVVTVDTVVVDSVK